jgi:GxxExxY protein
MDHELIHKDLSESIIGAAMTVLNVLKPGLDEKLYEKAMAIELRKRGHQLEQQRRFPVHYDGQLIGTLQPDLIVDDLVIADPKVVTAFNENHQANTDKEAAMGHFRIKHLVHTIEINRAENRPPNSYPFDPCNPWFISFPCFISFPWFCSFRVVPVSG